jgi:anti-anti-sigma factor
MTSFARVTSEQHGDTPVARLHGEIDSSNASAIGIELRSLLTNRSTTLIVDLTDVGYLDSAGINLLFTLGDELQARQLKLRIVVGAGTPIARVVAITSLDSAHPTFGSLDEALEPPG